jgi:uncharacterized protein
MMSPAIESFISSRRIAVVGASRQGKKFGNALLKELRQRGYEVRAVHPEAKELDGLPCAPSLTALAGEVDGVVVSVPPARVHEVLRDASAANIDKVWIQQGATSPEAVALAHELGLTCVSGKCILMYAGEVTSIHKVHRFFAKLFGRY